MSTKPFYIKRNDLQPYYPCQVLNSTGSPVNLTGATIVCTMKASDGTLKINRQSAEINITDAVNGEFEYRWQSGDTDTLEVYKIEFEITPQSGPKFTLPTRPHEVAKVIVLEDLDNT